MSALLAFWWVTLGCLGEAVLCIVGSAPLASTHETPVATLEL